MIERVIGKEKGREFEWLDIVAPSPEELEDIATRYGLHPIAVRNCLDPTHLPKMEQMDELSFLIVRAFDADSACHGETVQELTRKIAIFYSERFLLTIHRQEQDFIAAIKTRWRAKAEAKKVKVSIQPLHDLLHAVIKSYETPIAHLETGLDRLEADTFNPNGTHFDALEAYHLTRTASIIRRMIRHCLDVIARYDAHVPKQSRPYFQDLKEDGERMFLAIGDLVENINRILQLKISLASQHTNEASHRTNEVMRILTIYSVFFMPLNLIAGIYGMNFEHMPELKLPWAYPIVLIAMGCITFSIFLWFHRRGWLARRPRQRP